jgi:putative exosortase-associated protein (TIGR04073 family)
LSRKTILFSTIVIILLLLPVQICFAKTEDGQMSYMDRSLQKLGRGLHDTVFCIGEVVDKMNRAIKDRCITNAMTAGFTKGVGHMVERAAVGVYEIATFPIPQKPIMDPEFYSLSYYTQD